MHMMFERKLPSADEIKEQFPLSAELQKAKEIRDKEIGKVFLGESDKFLLVIGPCSADNADSVIDYTLRLRRIQEEVKDKIIIIPRVYTNKPRTTGEGYKGMVHQPDPNEKPDMIKGIMAIRQLHKNVIEQTGFFCADEMLYPDNYGYLSDILSYVAVGARSVENQQHRLVSSGMDIPVGMKNPTSGDYAVMMNSIIAARHSHTFIYNGWEVRTEGNPLSHAILRGSVNKHGQSLPNYHYEDLIRLHDAYCEKNIDNMALIVDANHANSNKKYLEQIRICKEVLHSCRHSADIKKLVKGFMIESYIEDGAQKIEDGVYGKSITDPCIGWYKTEKLILDIADLL
ncbi:MAG: 3-deoxy-7-phosphoheptulonate synthase [Clostridia bacterium]|nr:3-deoxy-7-phosphoheptulonate synthase [Clostridia bacterium]